MHYTKKEVIQFEKVSFAYGKNKDPTLIDLNFNIYKGEYIVVVGVNGSGKSTFGNLIAGLLKKYSGTIRLFGESLKSENHANLIQKVGVVFQNPESQFIGSNVEKDLVFAMENLCYSPNVMRNKLAQIVKKMNLQSILFSQPSELSGGIKQKVAFAASTIITPEIMIFDEPTSLLSPVEKEEIWKLINQLNKKRNLTVVELTHDINRALQADRLMIINKNKIYFFDTPTKIKEFHLAPLIEALGNNLPLFYQLVIALLKNKIITQPIWDEQSLIKKLVQWKK